MTRLQQLRNERQVVLEKLDEVDRRLQDNEDERDIEYFSKMELLLLKVYADVLEVKIALQRKHEEENF